ncbi:MAG: 2-dehydropantoate 2-reductase N-terminal domain-containing protein [Archangium sp.]
MRIAIIGAGGIGSSFASLLMRASHEVTLVARGARLAELEAQGLRVNGLAEPQRPKLSAALDEAEAYDLVLVTVLVTQVDVLLPALGRSKAKSVMFMFNTFGELSKLRDAVGVERFSFGFPAIVATVKDGELTSQVVPRIAKFFQITTLGGARAEEWRVLFESAGIPSAVHDDIESWLKSHAAFFAPLMLAGAYGKALSWAEASRLVATMKRGFALVPKVTPFSVRVLSWTPAFFITLQLWMLSRTPTMKALGGRGPAEGLALLKQMNLEPPL